MKEKIMNKNSLKPAEIKYILEEKHRTANRQFQGVPGIEVASGGRIWATWYSGGIAEGPQNFSILVTSNDDGETWSEKPVAVIDPIGNVRSFDPVLWHDPLGRLWWFWSQSYSPADGEVFDGTGGVWATFTEDSNTEQPVFSEPRRIADGVMMNKPTVLSDGTWLLPTAVWECFGPKLPEMAKNRFSNITVSCDNGHSFSLRGSADVPERSFDEHMIIELKDGRLWMLVRTMYGIGQSFSGDKGIAWTPGENSGLSGPNSRFFIRRLSSGRLLLVNNANPDSAGKMKRSHLYAFLSDDDGKTWQGGLLLDERDNVSYPDGAEDSRGVIRIIYDRERHKHGEILAAAFKEEDVLAGKCITPQARLRTLVNRTEGIKV